MMCVYKQKRSLILGMSSVTITPRWQPDAEAADCSICHRPFRLWFRRHHCRMCGRVACGNCAPTYERYLSTSHVVSPPSQPFQKSPNALHKTCTECAAELNIIKRALSPSNHHNNQLSEAARELLVQNVRPRQASSDLEHCPVCGSAVTHLEEADREAHVDSCLRTLGSSPAGNLPDRKRMLISVLNDKTCTALEECSICYEDFEPGQSVGRLECFCVFHKKCILEWFSRKGAGSCPLHNQSE